MCKQNKIPFKQTCKNNGNLRQNTGLGTTVGLESNYTASTNIEAARCLIISNKRSPTEWGRTKGVEVSMRIHSRLTFLTVLFQEKSSPFFSWWPFIFTVGNTRFERWTSFKYRLVEPSDFL